MLVTELMTQFAHTVESSMAMSDAAELMRDHNVGVLPVLEGERLTGMLTDRDLVVRGLAEGKDPELTTVREIMTPRVATVFDDQEIDEAIQVMRDNRVRRVAVISHDRRLLGVLSEADLPKGPSGKSELDELSEGVPTTLNTPEAD
jgi:CBS domain-containing protein